MKRGSIARFAMIAVLIGMLGLVGCASQQKPAPAPDTGSEWSEAPEPEKPAPEPVRVAKVELESVYFAAISDTSGKVTIEGHTDERGSAEYNLALGERRANAVKRYLVDLGVSSSKLRTVSFGEERPAVQGHDESAWRYNRRAEFVSAR
jgi:peptidoglycan-associated lipoprotein